MTDRFVSQFIGDAFPDHPIRFAALTDVGRVREQNEDACGVATRETGPLPVEAVLIAADGVGGHVGGAVASRFVVDAVRDTMAEQDSIAELGPWMKTLLGSIHRELLREAGGRGMQAAMGSTATVAAIDGTRLVLAHVGDSRAYRLRAGVLEQLSHDDSWVAEQVRAGLLSEDEIASNPQKNVLTQCLGIGESLKVHLSEEQLEPGDRYLLCSDGLHGEVDDNGLLAVLSDKAHPEVAAETLIDMANASGGPDNITAVVFDVGGVPGAQAATDSLTTTQETSATVAVRPSSPTPSTPRGRGSWVILAGLAVLIAAGVGGSWSIRPSAVASADAVATGGTAPASEGMGVQPARRPEAVGTAETPPAVVAPTPSADTATQADSVRPVDPAVTPDSAQQPDTTQASGLPSVADSTNRIVVGSPEDSTAQADSLRPDPASAADSVERPRPAPSSTNTIARPPRRIQPPDTLVIEHDFIPSSETPSEPSLQE